MDQRHKDKLRKHRIALIQDMDLPLVLDGLVQKNLFKPDAYENYAAEYKTKPRINRNFMSDLERKGPTAFSAFVDSLRESNHDWLVQLLDPDSTQDPFPGTQGDSEQELLDTQVIASPSEEFPQAAWPANTPADLSKQVMPRAPRSSYQDDSYVDEVYRMKSEPRGIAVIINNKLFNTMPTRWGTDIDGKNLRHVFEELGFLILYIENQTGEGMRQFLRSAANRNHESYDCFIVAILSHGQEGDIWGVDECVVKIEHIFTSYFESDQCPTLRGKPKLFFLQACRGERFDGGHEAVDSKAVAPSQAQPAEESEPEAPMSEEELEWVLERAVEDSIDASNAIRSKLPSQSDMLLAYATVPGFVSWRNPRRGTWFVQALCEVFLEHAPKEDLLSMITMVNDKVASAFESSLGRNKQIPAPVTMLRKKLYFNPGR